MLIDPDVTVLLSRLFQLLITRSEKKWCEKSTGTKMNDLGLRLEVVSRQVNHCVTFDVEYLGNR